MKADVAEQLKAEKSVTERTAEDAVVEASQIKHVAVERSLKMQTPQLRRSLWSQRRRRLSQIKATEEKSVSSVAETVLKHETVHEVAVDRTCEAQGAGEFWIEELF